MTRYVFGYGSLVADLGGHPAELRDARRAWNVAMDNSLDLPGYKHYLDVHGNRPDVCVAFLDLVDAPGERVDGVCHSVTDDELRALDRRERQYERRDVTTRVTPSAGQVFAYVGLRASRERATVARRNGSLWIARAYLESVPDAAPSDDLPVVDLRRVENP